MLHNRNRVRTSIRVLQTIIIGIGVILLSRMLQLQIFEYELYTPISRENSIRQQIVHPARGLILDRNGELLVDNEPIYSITITPSLFDKKNIPLLSKILNIDEIEVTQKIKEASKYSWYRASRLFTSVDLQTFSLIQENIWRLPGIGHSIESKRHYPSKVFASHIMGYLQEVTDAEYKSNKTYNLGDKIGRSGLERTYENQLRGTAGLDFFQVNALGQALGSYNMGELDVDPQRGANIITTMQLDIQLLAEELMKGKVGGVVAMDPNNGEILAMVSAPQYDVVKLTGKIDQNYWREVNADTLTPLFHRSISTRQPPGSTFKPLMGILGLELGIITPETEIYNPGAFYKGREYKDLAPRGNYNLEKAIANSSNTFFFSLMDKMMAKTDLNTWHEMLIQTGLGQINNIDLPNERSGIIPDSSYFDRAYGAKKWGIGDVINLAVGQGAVSASPLQMALVASELANGGYWVRPHVVKGIQEPDGNVLDIPIRKSKIPWMKEQHLEVVKKGMIRVVKEGSGRFYANLPYVTVAGKTGTAQNPHGIDHGWFICYAPAENPQIAVACLIENGGFGSISAAPIASLIMEQFFLGEIKRKWVKERMLNFVARPAISTTSTQRTTENE